MDCILLQFSSIRQRNIRTEVFFGRTYAGPYVEIMILRIRKIHFSFPFCQSPLIDRTYPNTSKVILKLTYRPTILSNHIYFIFCELLTKTSMREFNGNNSFGNFQNFFFLLCNIIWFFLFLELKAKKLIITILYII